MIICKYSAKVNPAKDRSRSRVALKSPLFTPTKIGVPTAPKVTGVLWIIIPSITAARAGKPNATISGAAMAAGVPKPDAPSIKAPKSQAMITTCTRRSELIPAKPLRMAVTAPECLSVLSSKIAPKMMKRMSKVMKRP